LYEYLSEEQIDHAAEALLELVGLLLRRIEEETSMERSQQLLVVLMHLHLLHKYLKKWHGVTSLLPKEQYIYTLLYELDEQISEKITYGYKKAIKSPEECVSYAK
jgi:hypothetical protein